MAYSVREHAESSTHRSTPEQLERACGGFANLATMDEVVTALVLRLVRTGLYEHSDKLKRSYRERLRLLDCDEAYIESVLAFGRNAAHSIRSQVEPMN